MVTLKTEREILLERQDNLKRRIALQAPANEKQREQKDLEEAIKKQEREMKNKDRRKAVIDHTGDVLREGNGGKNKNKKVSESNDGETRKAL